MPICSDEKRPLPDARRKSTGAPKGNQNALKHGNYTAAAQAALREKKREIRRILKIERRNFRELPDEWADSAFLSIGAPSLETVVRATRNIPLFRFQAGDLSLMHPLTCEAGAGRSRTHRR